MGKHLATIFKIFHCVKVALGIEKFQNSWHTKCQLLLRGFLCFSLIIALLSAVWTFYNVDGISAKLTYIILLVTALTFSIVTLILMSLITTCEALFSWLESLHGRFGSVANFEKCKKVSNRFVVVFCCIFPIATAFMGVLDCLIVGITTGKLESTFLSPSPFGTWGTLAVFMLHIAAVLMLSVSNESIYAVVLVTLLHFRAILQYIQMRMKALNRQTSRRRFNATIKDVVNLQCELIAYQEILHRFTFVPGLIVEFNYYTALLFAWVAVFFVHDLAFIGMMGIGNSLPYLILCGVNEMLADAFDDLRETLYDLEWYCMSAEKQRVLLMVMAAVDNPKVMRTGPFHVVCFEELAKIWNRVYNYGLFLNNFFM